MKDEKRATTFRLSVTALRMLQELAERGGTTKTAILEAIIRREASRTLKPEKPRP
jgi:predicted DNA-binding protein